MTCVEDILNPWKVVLPSVFFSLAFGFSCGFDEVSDLISIFDSSLLVRFRYDSEGASLEYFHGMPIWRETYL